MHHNAAACIFHSRRLQAKLTEYSENGAQLGWLIDPFKKNVYIYRQGEPVQCLEDPTTLRAPPSRRPKRQP